MLKFEEFNFCQTGFLFVYALSSRGINMHSIFIHPVFKLVSVIPFQQKQIYNKNTQYKTRWSRLRPMLI